MNCTACGSIKKKDEVTIMFCPKCGRELPDASGFCSYCGAKLDSEPAVNADQESPSLVQTEAQENPAPPQYVANGNPAPIQFIPQGNPAPAQFIPQGNPAPTQFTPQGNPAPTQFTPQSNPAPTQFTPQSNPAPTQFIPQGNPAPTQFTPQGNPAPTQFTPQGNPAPTQFTPQGNPAQYAPQGVPAPAAAGKAPSAFLSNIKKIPVKFIAIGAAALVAIIAIIAIIIGVSSSKIDNAYVYLSDGTFSLITNINKEEFVELDSVKYSYNDYKLLSFSEDGRYIYYYSKLNDYGLAGTLCRAEYKKLGNNATQNEKYIEVIAKDAVIGFVQIGGGLLYYNDSYNLYYYDGKNDPYKVANSVENFITDDKGRLIYLSDAALYGVTLKDADGKEKLASGVSNLVDTSDFDNILYTKSNSDGTWDMYTVGFNKDSEKVAEDISSFVYREDGIVYYLEDSGKTVSLYDYILDEYASQDAGITRPNEDDYKIKNYSYTGLYEGSWVSDYKEIYLALSDDIDFLYDHYDYYFDLYWDYYWYFNDYYDEIVEAGEEDEVADELGIKNLDKWKAIADFYDDFNFDDYSLEYAAEHDPLYASEFKALLDKYKSQADENGYVLVTDDMKKELRELAEKCNDFNQLFRDDDWDYSVGANGDTWLTFCYGKYESGSTIDDKYYEELDKYNQVADRIQLREELKSEYYDQKIFTLYRYENGKAATVSENVLTCRTIGGAVTYNTTDTVTDKINIDDLYWASDALSLFYYNYENDNPFILPASGKEIHMSESAREDFYEIVYESSGSINFSESFAYIFDGTEGLYAAKINGNTVDSFEFITDEAYLLHIDKEKNVVYYFSDRDGEYATLYTYDGKDTKALAKDILYGNSSYVRVYEDGVITVYTDSDRYGYSYELTVIDAKGNATTLDDEVTYYIRADASNLLYITDGDLYHYDGKKKTRLAYDVEALWSLNVMEDLF